MKEFVDPDILSKEERNGLDKIAASQLDISYVRKNLRRFGNIIQDINRDMVVIREDLNKLTFVSIKNGDEKEVLLTDVVKDIHSILKSKRDFKKFKTLVKEYPKTTIFAMIVLMGLIAGFNKELIITIIKLIF